MSSAEIDRRLENFATRLESDREVLRRKVGKLIRELNNGESTFSYWGIHVDILAEFERRLSLLNESQVRRALDILRE